LFIERHHHFRVLKTRDDDAGRSQWVICSGMNKKVCSCTVERFFDPPLREIDSWGASKLRFPPSDHTVMRGEPSEINGRKICPPNRSEFGCSLERKDDSQRCGVGQGEYECGSGSVARRTNSLDRKN
jgi:hypothetical protein